MPRTEKQRACRGTSILSAGGLTCKQQTLSFAYWCRPCLLDEIVHQRGELNRLERYWCPSCGKTKMVCDQEESCGGPQ